MLVELWRLAAEAFAGKTGDRVCLSPAAVLAVTGRERHFTGVSRLRTLCSRLGYEIVTDGSATFVTIRNFASKQGFDSAGRGVSTRTPAASDSDSDSESESGEKKEERREEQEAASPPRAPVPKSFELRVGNAFNLLANQRGEEADKRAWLRENLELIEAEAAKMPGNASATFVSTLLRYWHQHVSPRAVKGNGALTVPRKSAQERASDITRAAARELIDDMQRGVQK
jgi:hypothetical protein